MAKKIILVIGYLPPPFGGLETVTETVINSSYLKEKFEIIFLKVKCRRESKKRGKFGVLNIIYNLENLFNCFWKMLRYKPDIMYCPLAQNKSGFLRDSFFIIIGRLFRVKICLHFHGGNFDLFYKNQPDFLKAYIRFSLKKVDDLIVLAKAIKIQFRGLVKEGNIHVVYNCIDSNIFLSSGSERKIDRGVLPNVLFVGYISKAKGAVDLVKAASIVLNNSNEKVNFSFIGPIIDREYNITFIDDPHNGYKEIEGLIRENNLQNHVQVHTNSEQRFKVDSFLNADIFVFPSYSEGFGLVALEAMAAGLPVVMSKIGGLAEILEEGKNCLFVTPGNFNEIAAKLLLLLKDPQLRKKMGENNRSLVNKEFKPERFFNQLAVIWNS